MKPRMIIVCSLLLTLLLATSCDNSDNAMVTAEYGYVQFKVVKSGEAATAESRAGATLDRLSDAHKLTVVMQHDGSTITQTLPLSSYDDITAEWGVRSEKLRLLVGKYDIIGYYLYDNMDKELLTGGNSGSFIVEHNGLTMHNIATESVKRGMVTFRLGKELTRAEGDYSFSSIRRVDITVRNKFTQEITTFEKLPVEYIETFAEGSADESLYPDSNRETAYAACDTTLWIKAGNYAITGYTTYSDARGRNILEAATITELGAGFSVEDNTLTSDVEVPIVLSLSARHILDYVALKEIWLALDGPNWTFHGEEYQAGTNWNFNCDIDMWGNQPGVTLNGDGRVETINISGFGARGEVPEAIGELTELKLLYLGNHNELIGGYDSSTSGERIDAMDYHQKVLAYDGREALSSELKRVINSDPNMQPILSGRIGLKDVAYGNLTNGITGISRAIMRLTKLEQLFIANSPITAERFLVDIASDSKYSEESASWSWSEFTALTDVEIYNCSKLDRLPLDMLCNLPNIQSLNLSLNKNITGEQLKSDWEAIIDGASGDKIQILYLGYNNLVETPSHDYLKRMTKLGLLDCTNNRLERVHPFGKEVSLTTIYLDNNRITEIEAADDGYFCGLSQMETFSCSGNLLSELPDIFSARSIYTILTANFSRNNISSLQNGDSWRGVNSSTLNLAMNRFEELPAAILDSGSRIETLMLSGNGMRRIEKGAMSGPYSSYLTTIDLSFNKLSELPYEDFSAENLPYLYGIDLSSNCFSEFPYAPLSISTLTVMSIRQQRDDAGNRTLREWPTGLSTCPKMTAFYIGSNDLRKIDDVISPYILLFEIKDNPNISIDLSEVCPYIEMGYYELIYDSTQDIRGCDALNLE